MLLALHKPSYDESEVAWIQLERFDVLFPPKWHLLQDDISWGESQTFSLVSISKTLVNMRAVLGKKKKKNPFLSVHFSIFLLFPSILIHSCYLNVVCVAYSSVPSCLFHSIWDKYSLHQAMLDQIQPFESINRYLQKSKALNMRQTLHS